MITCAVTVEVKLDEKVVQRREWPAVDIMKTSVTRAWATRQFNRLWVKREPDQIILVSWTARYGEAQGHSVLHGSLSGVNDIKRRRGIFEE